MRYSFLALYIFLSLAYIALVAPSYRMAVVRYLLPVVGLFILDVLTPYLGAVCIILDFNKSYQETVLKTQRLPI